MDQMLLISERAHVVQVGNVIKRRSGRSKAGAGEGAGRGKYGKGTGGRSGGEEWEVEEVKREQESGREEGIESSHSFALLSNLNFLSKECPKIVFC